MMKMTEFMGAEAVQLCSGELRCIVLPAHGGKIVSLQYVKNGFELLFQNPKGNFRTAFCGADFSQYEACGFDDAFPSIDASEVRLESGRMVSYPDHGEIWTSPFSAEVQGEKLKLCCEGRRLPYHYEKTFELRENELFCTWHIRNTGEEAFPWLWAAHFLAAYEPDMQLIFPEGTESIEYVLDTDAPERAGKKVPFGDGAAFCSVPKPGVRMKKFYLAGRVREGRCGYLYPSRRMKAQFFFDRDALPYLGCWITAGGYRGDKNCALEPASGYYDEIGRAEKNRACSVLSPGASVSFQMRVRLEEI